MNFRFYANYSTITMVVVVLFAVGCSREARTTHLLEQANSYYEEGKYDEAQIAYLNVLKSDPQNTEAIAKLGIMAFEQGNYRVAVPTLQKASELDPGNADVRLVLGKVYASGAFWTEARTEALEVLRLRPGDPSAALLLAEASNGPTEIQEVRELAEGFPEHGPESTVRFVVLGTLAMKEGKRTEAEAFLVQVTNDDPSYGPAFLALGNLYWSEGEVDHAEEPLRRASELAPPRSLTKLNFVRFLQSVGKTDESVQLLEKVTNDTPDFLPAWLSLAEIAAAQGRNDDARRYTARILARDGGHPEARLLDARIRLAEGDAADAEVQMERLVSAYPEYGDAHFQLALARLKQGKTSAAIGSLNEAIRLSPDSGEAITLLAGIDLQRGDPTGAIIALEKLLSRKPRLIRSQFLLAQAYRALGRTDDAFGVYRRVDDLFPDNPQTSVLRGMLFAQQSRIEEAREAYNEALRRSADYIPALEQLVDLDLGEGKSEVAKQLLAERIEANPGEPLLHLLLAKVFIAADDLEKAEGSLKEVIALDPGSRMGYLMLARLYVDSGRADEALKNLQELLKGNASDTSALMLTGMIYHQQKDFDRAAAAYERLLTIDPDFSPALNNLAYINSEQFNDLERAYELALKSRELLPNDAYAEDTLGWILLKRGDYPWALDLLQESASRLPRIAEVQYHMGAARYMMGEKAGARLALEEALKLDAKFPGADEARRYLSILAIDPKSAGAEDRSTLEQAKIDNPRDPIVLTRLAQLRAEEGETENAISLFEQALKVNEKNVPAIVGLGWLYAADPERNAKALELANAAYELAPGDPEVAHLLGTLAYRTGNRQRAYALLRQAVRSAQGNAELLFDWALATAAMGEVQEAESAMRSALRTDPGFSRAAEAGKFVNLIEYGRDPSNAALFDAQSDQVPPDDPTFVPFMAALAAFHNSRGDIKAAADTYKKLLSNFPDFTPAKKELAIIGAMSRSEDNDVYRWANQARETSPNDPELARALGILSYLHGDSSRARSLIEESLRQIPADAETYFYLGMARAATNDRAGAVRDLKHALELGLSGDRKTETEQVLARIK